MEGYSLLVSIIEGDASITLREDGTLILESVDIALQYERVGDTPEAPAAPAGEATPEPTAEPAHEPAVTGAEIMLENKYVLIDADVNGYNMTAAMLGNYEYSVLLHQDGTVDFVMAGRGHSRPCLDLWQGAHGRGRVGRRHHRLLRAAAVPCAHG